MAVAILGSVLVAGLVMALDAIVNATPLIKGGFWIRARLIAIRTVVALCVSTATAHGVDLMLFRTEIQKIAGPHSGLLEQQQALSHLVQHDWTIAAFPVLLLIISLTVTIMKCVLPASRLDLLARARYAAAAESRAGRHRAS